ncbi:MAG: HEAT repeat domain-containing protein [Planctomycetaceae bacterium]|nr:HEAT repeat domain-containing protein [Planctomycetaceae bacterium]
MLTPLFLAGLYVASQEGLKRIEKRYDAEDLHTATPEKMAEITKRISNRKFDGIVTLVEGMTSVKSSVAIACFEALQEQIQLWKELSREEAALYYGFFTEQLAKNVEKFSETQLGYAAELCKETEKAILSLGLPGQLEIGVRCHFILSIWKSHQPAGNPQLITNQGVVNDANLKTSSGEPPRTVERSPESGTLAELSAGPTLQAQSMSGRITAEKEIFSGTEKMIFPKTSPFLDKKLLNISRAEMDRLPTQDLMRLLNHPIWEIGQISEEILKSRDGFQQSDLNLAVCLYHQESRVRISLLRQLQTAENLELTTWLTELLKDPDAEVRYSAAVAICQGNYRLESLQPFFRIISRDSDPRITALVAPVKTAKPDETNIMK